jgi:hypothetical protein
MDLSELAGRIIATARSMESSPAYFADCVVAAFDCLAEELSQTARCLLALMVNRRLNLKVL